MLPGDLAPLAHLSLPLLGEGEVYLDGFRQLASKVLAKFGLGTNRFTIERRFSIIERNAIHECLRCLLFD